MFFLRDCGIRPIAAGTVVSDDSGAVWDDGRKDASRRRAWDALASAECRPENLPISVKEDLRGTLGDLLEEVLLSWDLLVSAKVTSQRDRVTNGEGIGLMACYLRTKVRPQRDQVVSGEGPTFVALVV